MKDRYQQKRERLNLRAKVKRRLLALVQRKIVQPIRVKPGSVTALVVRRMMRRTMGRCSAFILNKHLTHS